jgi:cytochrome c oxidase assembly protein subunit 15
MPQGPVSWAKAWIEMIHRYAAMTVGFLILILFIETLREGFKQGRTAQGMNKPMRAALWCASLSLVWVMVQGLFGALTVTSKLFPAIVSLHLLGGMTLLVLLMVQWRAYAGEVGAFNGFGFFALERSAGTLEPKSNRLAWGAWLCLGACALLIQLALGAWVSTNYAVLACQTFPLCQEQWWPEMSFTQGFELWRPLGLTSQQEPLVFQALTAIHYTHRLMAYVKNTSRYRIYARKARADDVLDAYLNVHSDSDFAGCAVTQRSTIGSMVFLSGPDFSMPWRLCRSGWVACRDPRRKLEL